MKVAITGKLSGLREQWVERIKATTGMEYTSNAANADVLILGDTGSHGNTTKLKQARAHGAKIVDEKEFLDLVAGTNKPRPLPWVHNMTDEEVGHFTAKPKAVDLEALREQIAAARKAFE